MQNIISKESKIAVLCGGMSSEREISLRSGKNCLAALQRLGYKNAQIVDVSENIMNDLKGFEYAYMYPGFTKVIQAVGRVIRSDEDRGVAILIDERFTYSKYYELMPRHWKNKKIITNAYGLKNEILKFYKK